MQIQDNGLNRADIFTGERPRERAWGERRAWLLTRDFRLVWWSQMLSQIADGVSKLALLWFVYSVTGSPLKTTVIGLLQTVPAIVLGPLIGVSVDRWPKKAILIWSDVSRALLIGLIPCWVSVETFTVESLYVLVLLYGVGTAVFVPTLSASVPVLVPRRQFTAANALLQSTTSFGILLGPALGGLGIAAMGSQEVLCLNAVTYLASVACLLPLRMPHAPPSTHSRNPLLETVHDLIEGGRFALVERSVVWLMAIACLYTFATGAFTTLLPVFGKRLLNLGPVEVGYLWSSLGVGFLLMSVWLVRLTTWDLGKRMIVVTVSTVIAGLALASLIWAPDRLLATVLVGTIGMGFGTLTPIAWGILQEITPPSLLGRVMAIYTTFATAASLLGMTAFGWITQEIDERAGVVGIALVLLGMAFVTARFGRRIGKK